MADANSIQRCVKAIEQITKLGVQATPTDRLQAFREVVLAGGMPTIVPILPLLLNLDGKPYSLKDHFQFEPLFYARMAKNSVLRTARQVGKCQRLTSRQQVYLADGRRVAGQDLQVGDQVLSLGPNYRATVGEVSETMRTGRHPILKITTRTGVVLEAAPTHPFLKLHGWTRAGDLVPGNRIAAIRRGGVFRNRKVDRDYLVAAAYMIGDGHCGAKYHDVTSACEEVLREYDDACFRLNGYRSPRTHTTGNADRIRTCDTRSRVRELLAADGLLGKLSPEKFLPAWVFGLSRADTILFLSRLWATDGTICVVDGNDLDISYCSTSRTLALDVRSILTKLGFPSSIRQRDSWYPDEDGNRVYCRDAYVVRVETRSAQVNFLSQVVVPGKPAPVAIERTSNNNRHTTPIEVGDWFDELARYIGRKHPSLYARGLRRTPEYPVGASKMARYLDYFEEACPDHPLTRKLRDLVDGDVYWDEVVSIEPAGEDECWDIEVAGVHNYVIDGVVCHNSTVLAAHGIILANSIAHFRALYITPLFEQVRRLSSNYVKPFIEQSPVKSLWMSSQTENSVLQRTFLNHSMMNFSFALLNADRVRGLRADALRIDEVQDINKDHIPVIKETMSASKWALTQYTGSPKTQDNTIEGLWKSSSMAEWMIPCRACGKENYAAMALDLERMIGPYREDISDARPGTVCARPSCGQVINPRHGRWVHKKPERRFTFAGYHIPQPIMQIHYADKAKWGELLAKREGYGNYTPDKYMNEVLGEPCGTGVQLVSEQELQAACRLKRKNNPRDPRASAVNLDRYRYRILAVDWGGGGEEGISLTAVAVLGITSAGKIEVVWGRRLFTPHDHLAEARQCLDFFKLFRCHLVAHDYTGAGTLRETFLVQAGVSQDRIVPIQYVRAASANIMNHVAPTAIHPRRYYRVDKTRSLLLTCAAIRLGLISFFDWDYVSMEDTGLIYDFLSLIEEKTDTRLGSDMYTITCAAGAMDDFAQAVNIGCCTLWHLTGRWPDLTVPSKYNLSQGLADQIDPPHNPWGRGDQ